MFRLSVIRILMAYIGLNVHFMGKFENLCNNFYAFGVFHIVIVFPKSDNQGRGLKWYNNSIRFRGWLGLIKPSTFG